MIDLALKFPRVEETFMKRVIEKALKAGKRAAKGSLKAKASSYDTSKTETTTPQKVRESEESPALHQRFKKAKGS